MSDEREYRLTLEETETSLYQNATDRNVWDLATNDVIWHRRMESLDIAPYKTANGLGAPTHFYALTRKNVSIRRTPPPPTPEQAEKRRLAGERLRAGLDRRKESS